MIIRPSDFDRFSRRMGAPFDGGLVAGARFSPQVDVSPIRITPPSPSGELRFSPQAEVAPTRFAPSSSQEELIAKQLPPLRSSAAESSAFVTEDRHFVPTEPRLDVVASEDRHPAATSLSQQTVENRTSHTFEPEIDPFFGGGGQPSAPSPPSDEPPAFVEPPRMATRAKASAPAPSYAAALPAVASDNNPYPAPSYGSAPYETDAYEPAESFEQSARSFGGGAPRSDAAASGGGDSTKVSYVLLGAGVLLSIGVAFAMGRKKRKNRGKR